MKCFNTKKKKKKRENKDSIIKDRLIRDIRVLFEEEKREKEKRENEDRIIKDRIIRDIGTLLEEQDYYKPKRTSNFWNKKYVDYESNGDRNKNSSLEEHLNKTKP